VTYYHQDDQQQQLLSPMINNQFTGCLWCLLLNTIKNVTLIASYSHQWSTITASKICRLPLSDVLFSNIFNGKFFCKKKWFLTKKSWNQCDLLMINNYDHQWPTAHNIHRLPSSDVLFFKWRTNLTSALEMGHEWTFLWI